MDRTAPAPTFALAPSPVSRQHGGTLLGFIVGLVVGLAVALGVAIYITKVPVPFMNKGLNRSAERDAAEEQKNKDWDPNAPLYGKNPARPVEKAEPADAAAGDSRPKDAATQVDPKSADPIGDLAKASEAKSKSDAKAETKPEASDPFIYYVQAGAYRTSEEAEAQRARLGMIGLEAKISEREQGGRVVHRVRVGPLNTKVEAERVRDRLEDARIDSAMVRVQR